MHSIAHTHTLLCAGPIIGNIIRGVRGGDPKGEGIKFSTRKRDRETAMYIYVYIAKFQMPRSERTRVDFESARNGVDVN